MNDEKRALRKKSPQPQNFVAQNQSHDHNKKHRQRNYGAKQNLHWLTPNSENSFLKEMMWITGSPLSGGASRGYSMRGLWTRDSLSPLRFVRNDGTLGKGL